MNDWTERQVEKAIRTYLRKSFEMRPYRRLIVGEENTEAEDRLSLTVKANSYRNTECENHHVWSCDIYVQTGQAGDRRGIDSFLEVIDIMHEADIDGGELVVIDVLFRQARQIDRSDESDTSRIRISFDVFTVFDSVPAFKCTPESITA
mgnify:CR=1 FL=1